MRIELGKRQGMNFVKALDKKTKINLMIASATLVYQVICFLLFVLMSGDNVEQVQLDYLIAGIPGGLAYLAFLAGWWIFLLLWKGRTKRIITENLIISLVGGLLNILAMGCEWLLAYSISMV